MTNEEATDEITRSELSALCLLCGYGFYNEAEGLTKEEIVAKGLTEKYPNGLAFTKANLLHGWKGCRRKGNMQNLPAGILFKGPDIKTVRGMKFQWLNENFEFYRIPKVQSWETALNALLTAGCATGKAAEAP